MNRLYIQVFFLKRVARPCPRPSFCACLSSPSRPSQTELKAGLRRLNLPFSSLSLIKFFELVEPEGVGLSLSKKASGARRRLGGTGDAWLTRDDFRLAAHMQYSKMRRAFEELDANRDGKIGAREIELFAERMGLKLAHDEISGLLDSISTVAAAPETASAGTAAGTVAGTSDDPSITLGGGQERKIGLEEFSAHFSARISDVHVDGRFEHWLKESNASSLSLVETKLAAADAPSWINPVAGALSSAISRTCTAPMDRIKTIIQASQMAPAAAQAGGTAGCAVNPGTVASAAMVRPQSSATPPVSAAPVTAASAAVTAPIAPASTTASVNSNSSNYSNGSTASSAGNPRAGAVSALVSGARPGPMPLAPGSDGGPGLRPDTEQPPSRQARAAQHVGSSTTAAAAAAGAPVEAAGATVVRGGLRERLATAFGFQSAAIPARSASVAVGLTPKTVSPAALRATASFQQANGIRQAATAIFADGGVRAFWRGNLVNVAKASPEGAVRWWVFEHTKPLICVDPDNHTMGEHVVCGGIAGAVAQSIIYPLEVAKTRYVLAPSGTYRSMGHVISSTLKQEGPKGLYRGLNASLLGIVPYSGVELATFNFLKKAYSKLWPDREPTFLTLMLCGGSATALGQVFSYPLQMTRTRLQSQGMKGRPVLYDGVSDLLVKVWRAEGMRGLYRGIGANFTKAIPSMAISLATYDTLVKTLAAWNSSLSGR
jgi:hypothetical protein